MTTALAGCAADPADRGVPFKIPTHFSGASASAPEPSLDRWWTRFRSAELDRLVALADVGNYDVAAAVARLSQAEAQARIAGAGLFPTLDYSGAAQRSQSSGTSSAGFIGSPSTRASFNLGLSASYLVDIWGQIADQKRSAELIAQASAYERETVRLASRAAVVNAYFLHASAQDQLRIASENTRNAERILGVIRERLAAGTGTALDVAQQETLVATQRANIPPLRQQLASARSALALLLGRPPQGFSVAAAGLRGFSLPRVTPGLPASLLARRPDIRSLESQLAAADANVEAARKALLPAIQLTGSGGFQSALLSTLLRPESAIYSLAAGISGPIFDGGRLRGQIALSAAQRQEILENYRKAIVSGLTDVENALTAIRESAAREAALQVAIAKARAAFSLSEERLRQGTIDLVTLLNTQQTLYQAQDAMAQNRLTRLQAAASLYQALGGDWMDRAPQPVPLAPFAESPMPQTPPAAPETPYE